MIPLIVFTPSGSFAEQPKRPLHEHEPWPIWLRVFCLAGLIVWCRVLFFIAVRLVEAIR